MAKAKEMACKRCHAMVNPKIHSHCPVCNAPSDMFSASFSGILIVLKPEKSSVAKHLKHEKPGAYAIRVR